MTETERLKAIILANETILKALLLVLLRDKQFDRLELYNSVVMMLDVVSRQVKDREMVEFSCDHALDLFKEVDRAAAKMEPKSAHKFQRRQE